MQSVYCTRIHTKPLITREDAFILCEPLEDIVRRVPVEKAADQAPYFLQTGVADNKLTPSPMLETGKVGPKRTFAVIHPNSRMAGALSP